MTIPADTFIEEFLYRGRPPTSAELPQFHVVIGKVITDAMGVETITLTQALTPGQAAAGGWTLQTIISGITDDLSNDMARVATENATLTTRVAELEVENNALRAQLAANKPPPMT